MNNIIRFDAIYRTLLAISKPMYLCVMNEDPVMMAFKIAETCEQMASTLTVAKDELLAIKSRCEKFAADFIKHASTFEDLELILSQMTTENENIVAPGYPFERLKYAMINNHMDFVANRSVQKLLKKKFYQGPIAINDFEGANMVKRSLYISALIMLTPVWLFLYTFYPSSDSPTGKFVNDWMNMPIMRFIVNAAIYLIVCIMVINSGMNTEIFPLDKWPVLAAERLCWFEYSQFGKFDCIQNNLQLTPEQKEQFRDPDKYDIYVKELAFELFKETFTNKTSVLATDIITMIWLCGNVYQESAIIWTDGVSHYFSDWVNLLNFLLNLCFLSALSLRYSFIVSRGYSPIQIFGGEIYHPLQVSSALKALGLLLLLYKLYKYLRVTQIVGRQQVLLVEAFKASLSLLIQFFIMAVAFSVASNGVIWHTYRDYIKNCEELPDGSFSTKVDVKIPCPTNLVDSSLDELIKYQNFLKVSETYFLGIFSAQAYILDIFPSYENAQEWTGTLIYSSYVFFMIIIRLNILTSLVIFSVMNSAKTESEQFKGIVSLFFFPGQLNVKYLDNISSSYDWIQILPRFKI